MPAKTKAKKLVPDSECARAVVKGGVLQIRVPVSHLKMAVQGACDWGTIDPPIKLTDVKLFAKEVCSVLNDESEEGSTAIHRMFDAAFNEAIDRGAEGFEDADLEGEDE